MSKFIGLVSAYAYAKSKGYTGTEEEFAILMAEYASVTETAVEAVRIATESAQSAAAASSDVNKAAATVTQQAAQVHDDAETSSESAATASEAKETAVDKALDSEAYALGTRDGEDVGTSDPAYHNNAKYYAESVSTSVQTATEAAQTATQKASEAQASASAAAESARTLTIDATLTQAGQAADSKAVGNVFANIGYTEDKSVNLLNPSELEAGRIISSSSSVLHTGTYDTDYRTTGFMPVEAGKKYGFYYKTSGNIVNLNVANIWAYDINKDGLSYVGSIASNPDGTTYITAPNNSKYIRASIVTAAVTTYGLLQFSETDGTAPSDIVEYFNKAYLDGYTQKDEFNALKTDVDSIGENFTDVYRDLTGIITSSKYINGNGTITDISSNNYKILTVQASPAKKYKITGSAYYNTYYYAFYDENGNFISGLKATESGTTSVVYDVMATAPQNAKTLVAASNDGTQNIKGVVRKASTNSMLWTDKKWVVFGDSITEVNARTTKHYFDYVSEKTGITIYNMGNSGSGYAREQDIGTAFYQRISAVPTDADVITIFGSFNDLGAGIPLGTASDTGTTTLGGCINATLDNLYTAFPLANVGVVTPTPWTDANPTNEPNSASEYVQLIRDICNKRSIPCLDLFHCSALRPWEASFRELAYSKDGGAGCHPDETGHKIIASRFKAFLETLLM